MQDPPPSEQFPTPKPGSSLNTSGISANQFCMLMDKIKKNHDNVQQRLDKLEGDAVAG